MKFNTDKKSQKSALMIVLIGAVLGATIMFWKKDSGGAATAAPHTEEGVKKQSGEHAGEEGVILMNAKQIQTAGITVAKAESAAM